MKSEIRNSKFETNPNRGNKQSPETLRRRSRRVWIFPRFEFRNCFGFRISNFGFVFALLLATMAPSFAHAQSRQWGYLKYPAHGNIQLDEGTVELYVVSGFDSEENWKGDPPHATFFDLVFPDENFHYVISFIGWSRGISMVGYAKPQQSYVSFGHPRWKPGENRVVAWTWSGRKRTLIVDGKIEYEGKAGVKGESVDEVVEGGLSGDMTKAFIQLGSGYFSIDEIRISSIARTPEELIARKDTAPVADAHTLLLDHCDGGPAEVIAGRSGETGSTLQGSYEIIDAKYGKAIKLWKDVK